MAKKFDATLKVLYEASPLDWPRFFGYEATAAGPVDSDTSISSGAADKAIRVHGPPDWIMHIEFQSGPDASLPQRMNLDSAILQDRTDCYVQSVVILLRKAANLTVVNGVHADRFPNAAEPYRTFRYQVLRLWEVPVEQLLEGGPTLVALAPLAAVAEADVPTVIAAMKTRFAAIPDKNVVAQLWTSVNVLMGLTYERATVERLLKEVMGMEESVTYQAILEKGDARGEARGIKIGEARGEARGILLAERDMIRKLGQKKLGPIPAGWAATLDTLTDAAVLAEILEQILTAKTWDEAFSGLTP